MDKHIQELLDGAAVATECVHAASQQELPEDWFEDHYIAYAHSLAGACSLQDYRIRLVSGDAHIDLLKDGCAVYALPEDKERFRYSDLKFAADRMLVRGINRFILPAACENSQAALTDYLQRMSYLFEGGKSVPQAALLHCEDVLQSGYAGDPQVTAGALNESQIGYDIISSDLFAEHRVDMIYDRLIINGNRYQALIVPDSARITAPVLGFVLAAEETDFPVIFTGQRPSGILGMDVSDAALMLLADTGTLTECSGLTAELVSRGIQDVRLTPVCPDIVSFHYRRENHLYLFLNESADQTYEGQIYMPGYQEAAVYDAEANTVLPLSYQRAEKGILADVRIRPRELLTVVFG